MIHRKCLNEALRVVARYYLDKTNILLSRVINLTLCSIIFSK